MVKKKSQWIKRHVAIDISDTKKQKSQKLSSLQTLARSNEVERKGDI